MPYRLVMRDVRLVGALLAIGAGFAAAGQLSDTDRYLERADRETRKGDYQAAAITIELVLALHATESVEPPAALFLRHAEAAHQAERHKATAVSATRYLLAPDRPAGQDHRAVDLVKMAEAAMANERNVQRAREAAEQAQRQNVAGSARHGGSSARANGPKTCEVPGFPTPDDVQALGLSWCPPSVGFQLRVYALQAAGGWCAIRLGTSSTPEQIAARHDQIVAGCDRLDALAANNGGPSCRCPAGYRP